MWWINKFGHVTGPYSDDQISKLIRNNQLQKLHKISDDRQMWQRVDQTEFWNPQPSGPEEIDLLPDYKAKKDAAGHTETVGHLDSQGERVRTAQSNAMGRKHIILMPWIIGAAGIFVVSVASVCIAIAVFRDGNGRPESRPPVPSAKDVIVPPPESGPVKPEGDTGDDFASIKKKVALIHGKKSVGTGFLLKMDGKKYLVTNEHVARGAELPEAEFVDGTRIELGALSLALDRDLARFEVDTPLECLEMSDGVPNNNDEIWVYGNSRGDDVITSLRGFITGVGSKVLKTNAEFVGGNSGSPIVDKDGKVLGVASYLLNGDQGQDWTTRNTSFDEVRRFGIRFTNVRWIGIDHRQFEIDCERLEAVDVFWQFLAPYLVCLNASDAVLATLKLEHKDVDRRSFGRDDFGFHELLLEVSASFAAQNQSWTKWQQTVQDRDALIKRLNEEIQAGNVSYDNGVEALREFDQKRVDGRWDKVKDLHRGFILKRKEALLMLRGFLQEREWRDPMMKSGYGDDGRKWSVEWYLEAIQYFLDQNAQALKDLNAALKKLESGDDDE